MKQQIKRVLSLLLVTCMIFCGLPADVYAVGESQAALETTVETTESETSAESTTNADESSDDTEAQESEKETTQTEAETTEKSVETTSAEKNTKSEESNYAVALTADEEASTTADTSTTETTSTIIAMSDYQNSSLSSGKKKTVPQTIVNAMVSADVSPELVLLGGDYVDGSVGADGSNTSASEMATEFTNLTGIIKSGWSSITDDKILAIQGNHDASQFLTDRTLDATGAYEYDNYIIYLINEDSFPWWQGGYDSYSDTKICKTAVTNTADDLETYLESLIKAGDHRPVIIMSHVPMHWSQRSTTGKIWWNDNIYADILFDVVNEAAKELDILFLFGHNHSSYSSLPGGYDNEIGGALAYVAKTESMKVPNSTNGTDNYTTKTLNFTYMNAGYVGNYNGSTKDCSISAITIDSDSIDIDRYTYNGTVDNETIALTGGSDSSGDDESSNNSGSDEGTSTGTTTTGEWVELPASESGYEQITSLENISSTDKYLVVVWRYFGRDPKNKEGYVFHDENNGDIKVTGSDGYATITSTSGTIDDGCYWYITNNGDGTITMKNADTGDYLGSNIKADSSSAVDLNITSATYNEYQNFSIGYKDKAIRYSNSSGTFSFSSNTTSSGASSANACNITLYKVVSASDGGYARLSGVLEQNYTTVSVVSEETVLGNVKVETSTDGSTVSETIDVTSDMVTWDTEFDGSTAGTYTGTVTYEGKELGEITVTITAKSVTNIELVTATGSVTKNSSSSAVTGGKIKVTYSDDTSEELDVTVGMLSGDNLNIKTEGTYENLTVTYGGKTVDGFTLTVNPKTGNNYPEYPNEGSVKVNKTGTGIDFQSSGIAQVELSTSGIPMNQGVDVVVVLDTSSSMQEADDFDGDDITETGETRLAVLRPAVNSLITQLQTTESGSDPNLDIAIVCFNGFTGNGNSSTKYGADNYIGDTAYATPNAGGWLTDENGDGWVSITELSTNWADENQGNIDTGSGTNYDEGLQMAYDLLTYKQEQNAANGETRQQYVVFMSDGAPFQYNGVYSNYTQSEWENWLLGNYETEDDIPGTVTNKNYYSGYAAGTGQDHRIAEAIKGDSEQKYEIVTYTADTNGTSSLSTVNGLGATMYSIGFLLKNNGQVTNETQDIVLKNIASSEELYFDVDTAAQLDDAFSTIASSVKQAATNARFVDQMGDAYNLQLATVEYASEGSTTKDKSIVPAIEVLTYDIYTRADYLAGTIDEDKIGDRKGTYTINEVVLFSEDGTKAYSSLIDVDGDGTKGVTINSDGTYTISDDNDNIFGTDGVIYAKYFLYNSNATEVSIENVSIPTSISSNDTTSGSSTVIPSESFYWILGTVGEKEQALRYYVYLEGSMEGTREAGSYPTNKFATLYYDNWLENSCYKDTVSPVLAWKSANVSYAFYLVNENGEIIVNQTTGATGSFANKIAVTNPVVYEEILLNNQGNVQAISVTDVENSILPLGYELYDPNAAYTVAINSNSTGLWEITYAGNSWSAGQDEVLGTYDDEETIIETSKKQSTYVTQYHSGDASAYSNVTGNTDANDYTHTVVWFAVLWKVQALPDTVVIDYGLPVDISVLTNDMFGENGKLAGVGVYNKDTLNLNGHDAAVADDFSSSYTGTYGTATADASTGKVRYTLNTSNGMQMQTYEKFAYAVNYTGDTNAGYYYDTVTVIPATTIYYEDDFLTYGATNTKWKDEEGTAVTGATQAEDRPGAYSLTDANNIYGYDGVNLGMSTFSLGSAKKVHVDADSSATASFTFYGTGFDVISMTSNTTGTIAVKVTAAEDIVVSGVTIYEKDTKVKAAMVNTYYGYTSEQHEIVYTYTDGNWVAVDKGKSTENTVTTTKPDNPTEGSTYTAIEQVWIATPDKENALYQVPVMQIEELPYGKYSVLITATYASSLDKTTAEGYDLYMDAVRIYDPANDGAADGTADTTIENAYVADGEGWPSYIELRNSIISASSFDDIANDALTTDLEGLVFIDGDASVGDAQISDYESYGPNNEVYLAPGQSVAFILSTPSSIKNIHIGVKSADGVTGTYTITNIARNSDDENNVSAGDYYNAKTYTVGTTTDMYYNLTGWKNDIIVITNTGNRYKTTGIISLTNIKSTYISDPAATVSTASDETESDVSETNGDAAVAAASEENTSSETYLYMTPVAATLTLRSLNSSVEEKTESETTAPETTIPEETESETTETETTQPEETEQTEQETTTPEETETESTESETTQPEETEQETTETEETQPESNSGSSIINLIKKLLGWLFG